MAGSVWLGRRFVVRRDRMNEARERLGIAEPVEVRIVGYSACWTKGRFVGFRDGSWRIALDTYLSARDASRTLWHELVHVTQAQREGGFENLDRRLTSELHAARLGGRIQRRYFRSRAYARMPLELEAERESKRWHRALPLAERHSTYIRSVVAQR